ncbi:MAG: hypothetical protein QXN71_02835 [Candidatus Aenigmatarchaeota archaeon]
MSYIKNPFKIFEENRRKYAQLEESYITDCLEVAGHNPIKAYTLAHLEILRNTISDTMESLGDVCIFQDEIGQIDRIKDYINKTHFEKKQKKEVWKKIASVWDNANEKVQYLNSRLSENLQ